jgi:SAM-dependent methyltransferase
MKCRFCSNESLHQFVDLGHQPPSNSFLTRDQLDEPETHYPLKVYVCEKCWLVQLPESKKATEIFSEAYPYYSSQSPANVSHAKEYVEMMRERFKYGKDSRILEIGSNDGYLLQHFLGKVKHIRGYEPSNGPAKKAWEISTKYWKDHGDDKDFHPSMLIRTNRKFFNTITCRKHGKFDLICGINVLAHQPDINDFVEGLRIALKPDGVVTMEFPYLMRLVAGVQFDTIYLEHYSYYSFTTIREIFRRHGLCVFDVDIIPEHGGSLRIYVQNDQGDNNFILPSVRDLLESEHATGITNINYYYGFQYKVDQIKLDLVSFLIDMRSENKLVAAYGSPAKGNTLLNYCGIRDDLVSFSVDKSPYKQNKFLPGSHIQVCDEEYLKKVQPDYILILPWNLRDEIVEQLSYARSWGCQFVIAIPTLGVF